MHDKYLLCIIRVILFLEEKDAQKWITVPNAQMGSQPCFVWSKGLRDPHLAVYQGPHNSLNFLLQAG